MPRFDQPGRSIAIGARICIARITAGLSLPELAAELRISHQQLYKYERGISRLPAVMLDDLGRLLDRPVLFFIETDDVALCHAATLQRPEHPKVRSRFDRAMDALKSTARDGRAAGERIEVPA